MLRSITFIKVVHSAAFVLLGSANLIVLYSALTGDISRATWIAYGLVLAEGFVLMLNGWRCPLRTYAERVGAVSGQITDIFLPKWFADRIFPICGGMLAFSTILLIIRLISSRL